MECPSHVGLQNKRRDFLQIPCMRRNTWLIKLILPLAEVNVTQRLEQVGDLGDDIFQSLLY